MTFREFSVGTDAYHQSRELRERVLRKPLGLVLSAVDVDADDRSFHLGCFVDTRLVGSLLLIPLSNNNARLRQVAVRPEDQRRGVGSQLLAFAERFARERGYLRLQAHARISALKFYQAAGYVASGELFLEVNLEHQLVTKDLQ